MKNRENLSLLSDGRERTADAPSRRPSWRGYQAFIGLALTAVIFSACGGGDAESEAQASESNALNSTGDWPIFRGDSELQGVYGQKLTPPLELAWTFEPPIEEGKRSFPIEATAVIADGVVYVGNQGGRFFAIDLENGSLIWEFEADGPVQGPAAVFGARIFFGDTYGVFYALNAEGGTGAWRFETGDKIEGGVNFLETADGKLRVFFGSHDYYLYSLDGDTGELLWKHETENYILATPSLVNSGGQQAVTFGGCDGLFHIVPADGSGEPRSVEVGSYIANSSAVRDGIAYVAHNGGEVLAVEIETGEIVWKVQTGQEYRGSAAVGEKTLFVPSPDKKLTAYDRMTGEVVWTFLGRRAFDSSPVITPDTIWQAGVDGFLYAIDPETGEEQWSWELGVKVKASPAISRGALVLCGDDGVVYAFRASSPSS